MPPVTSSSKMNTRQLFDNKENIPPAGPKSFEAFSNVYNPQFGRPPFPLMNRSDEERQNILEQRQKKEANYVVFGPFLEYMVPTRKAISMQWHSLKYEALTATERHYVDITAHCLWKKELAGRKLRSQKATTKWMEDQDVAYQAIISHTKTLDRMKTKRSKMPHETTPGYFKHKLNGEIYAEKCFIESNQKKLGTLQTVDAKTIEKQAEDAEMAWEPYGPAQKNKKKPAAKKAGRKTRSDRQRDQESPVSARNVATGTAEQGRGQSKPEPGQKPNPLKRKNKPTLKEVEAQRAKSNEDQLKAMDGDSEGYSDVDEAIRAVDQPNPSKKRKISPKYDGTPAETGQVGVARHLNRSGRPLRKAAVKNNASRQYDDKDSPVPTTSSDTSKSTSTDEKEQSSSPPTSHTSTSSKRKQPSSTDSEEPATTPKSGKSMSPPAHQQPRSESPKRKRVSESDEQESASKKQALEVDGSQIAAPVTNNLNSEDEKVEPEPEESFKSVETSESNTNRKMAVPKTSQALQLDSSDEEPNSHEEQSSAFSDKASVGSASVRSIDTSSKCNTVEEQSIRDNKEDEKLDIANKGKEVEQAVKETKEGGENNDSSAPVVPNTSEMPSPAPVAAPDVPKTKKISFKDFNLKDYKAARPEFAEKCKAHVEDIGKAKVQQSDGEAQVEEFGSLFEGLGEKVIW